MQGPKKTPYAPIRRDDRAEPDDDSNPMSTPRIDVVNVDGPGSGQGIPSPVPSAPRSEVAQGITSLRSQLMRLNEQAAAVEKSLDEQRRDRSEALDRLEKATERCISLETKVTALESETRELQSENASLHTTLEESMRAAATFETELTDVRKRQFAEALKVTDLEGEVALLEKRLETAAADLEAAKSITAKSDKEIATAREEAMQAREAAAKADSAIGAAKSEASKLRDEAAKLRDEAKQLRDETQKLRDEGQKLRDEAQKARDESQKLREESTRLTKDLDRAKEDSLKDRATARDRIDLLERALDDARGQSSRTEAALEASRENEDTMGRQLEAAMERASDAKARAAEAQASQHALEQNVRRLREAIAKAFAKIGHGADKPPIPRSSTGIPALRSSVAPANDQDAEAIAAAFVDSVPPSKLSAPPGAYSTIGASMPPGSIPPLRSVPPPSGTTPSSPPESIDNEWAVPESPESVPPPAGSSVRPSASPTAKSSIPPATQEASSASSMSSPPSESVASEPTRLASVPPPTYASVPPQIHAQPYDGPIDETTPGDAAPKISALIPSGAANDSLAPRESTAPETKRGGMSSFPVPSLPLTTMASTPPSALSRDELLARLGDPLRAGPAAAELKQHPEWLTSVPPTVLIAALQSVDYDADRPVFDLARLWEREPLCHALIAALRSEPEARLREHAAWLLKHLAAPSSWKAIADLARSEEEGIQLRRWLLEALDRLAAGRGVSWRELGDVVTAMAKHHDASLRDGVVGILVSLERSDEKRRILLDILRADDDEVVLASAVDALAGALPVELDPNLVERLLGHPSARVQRSVRDLIERAKRSN